MAKQSEETLEIYGRKILQRFTAPNKYHNGLKRIIRTYQHFGNKGTVSALKFWIHSRYDSVSKA